MRYEKNNHIHETSNFLTHGDKRTNIFITQVSFVFFFFFQKLLSPWPYGTIFKHLNLLVTFQNIYPRFLAVLNDLFGKWNFGSLSLVAILGFRSTQLYRCCLVYNYHYWWIVWDEPIRLIHLLVVNLMDLSVCHLLHLTRENILEI